MTFSKIALKIFKANFRRYLLIFLCCSFAIMIFFTYSTIFTNSLFMDSDDVNSTITSMIIAPSMGVVIFCIFFVMYAHSAFIKFRKTEFGMFMVLGMTNTDIGKIILLENGLIGLASLVSGLFIGQLFSRIFYFIVLKLIDTKGIHFSASYKSYLYTVVFFVSIYSITLLFNFLSSQCYKIITLLKESRREDKNISNSHVFTIAGIILICISIFDIAHNFKTEIDSSIVLGRSVLLCFIGIYLLISNLVWIMTKILKFSRDLYIKNVLFISNLKYTFGQSRKILFLITLLMSITIFFSCMSVSFISDSQKFATDHTPDHVAYTEFNGMNAITETTLNSIVKSGDTPLVDYKSIEFINQRAITLLSDEDLNKNLGTDIHVKQGQFINLFQVVMDDGYTHINNEIKNIELLTSSGKCNLISQGKMVKVLFNNVQILSPVTLILNGKDYLSVKACEYNFKGTIKLMNFENWHKTQGIVDKLSVTLAKYNSDNGKKFFQKEKDDIFVFKPMSRIGLYSEQIQGGSFLLFLVSFVGILFFMSCAVILHFKLLTEFEREKIKYRKLYKIGITDMEVAKVIKKELKVLFFLPSILALIIATTYSFYLPIQGGKELMSAGYSIAIGLIYICFQAVFYSIYKSFYVRKFYNILKH